MYPRKLNKKEIKELKKQFPALEEKASWLDIAVMIFWIIILVGVLYLFYLVWNYRFIGVW